MIFIDEYEAISNDSNYLKILTEDSISYYVKKEQKNRNFIYKMIDRQVENMQWKSAILTKYRKGKIEIIDYLNKTITELEEVKYSNRFNK